ncbi:hypothetical protein ZWY2020_006269 [Hordeum vulgare]|nr:hypothetical protein ZWY2020_006269 [Hordeum vulgare]
MATRPSRRSFHLATPTTTRPQLAEPARRVRPAPDIPLADLLSFPVTSHIRELQITSEDSSYLMHLESSSLDTDFQELCWKATYGIEEICRNEWNWVKKNPTLVGTILKKTTTRGGNMTNLGIWSYEVLDGVACFGFEAFHVMGLYGPRIWVSDPYGLTGKVEATNPAWVVEVWVINDPNQIIWAYSLSVAPGILSARNISKC